MTKEEEEDYSRPQYFLKCFYLYESYTEHVINASLLHISHIDDDVFDSPSLFCTQKERVDRFVLSWIFLVSFFVHVPVLVSGVICSGFEFLNINYYVLHFERSLDSAFDSSVSVFFRRAAETIVELPPQARRSCFAAKERIS